MQNSFKIGDKINDVYILGNVLVDNVMYYIDINKNVYYRENDEYIKLEKGRKLKKVLGKITPKSIDVI